MPEELDWESAVLDGRSDDIPVVEEEETYVPPVDETTDSNIPDGEEIKPATVDSPSTETTTEEKKSVAEIVPDAKPENKELVFKDEASRLLYQAILEGKDDEVANYLAAKKKDYNTMSDADVLREHMKAQNPLWTEKDIDLEMKQKFKAIPAKIDVSEIDEYDTDAISQANDHNENVEYLENVREREARIARAELDKNKPKVELPKIDFTQAQEEFTPEQIQQAKEQWEQAVESEIPKLSDIKVKVGDEEVIYKATDDEKKEFTAIMKNFNDLDYLTKRGWYDEQGNINVLKVAEDVRLLESKDKMFASFATQLKSKSTKEVISKDIKNIDFDTTKKSNSNYKGKSFEDTVLDA